MSNSVYSKPVFVCIAPKEIICLFVFLRCDLLSFKLMQAQTILLPFKLMQAQTILQNEVGRLCNIELKTVDCVILEQARRYTYL